jgi:hypothetical protein
MRWFSKEEEGGCEVDRILRPTNTIGIYIKWDMEYVTKLK